jgi:uncharacterized membrane protein YbhN (UPF0104 family)
MPEEAATRRPLFNTANLNRAPARLGLSAVKLLLSGGLIGYLVNRHGVHYDRFEGIDPVFSTITIAIVVLQIALNTVRWRLILRHVADTAPPYRRLFGVYYASIFLSQILPSIGGDLVRVLYGRTLGSTPGPLTISVILDRGLALTALLFIALLSLPFLNPFDQGNMVVRSVGLVASGGLVTAYGGCLAMRAMRVSRLWTRLPEWPRYLVISGIWALTSRTGMFRLIPLSAIVHLLSFVAILLAARTVHVPLTFFVVLAIGPVLLLAHILPISIGGWGVREAAAVALLGMTGIDATSALLVSIMFGVLLVLAALPGAVFWLILRE